MKKGTWECIFSRTRSDINGFFLNYISWLERHLGKAVEQISRDNTLKFVEMRKTFESTGIRKTSFYSYRSQSSGLAEKLNRTLLKKTRASIINSGMNQSFWREALCHVTSLHSWTTTLESKDGTPVETVLGSAPDNLDLRLFWCVAFVHWFKKVRRDQFKRKTEKGVYWGNQHSLHGVRLTRKKSVVIKKPITFDKRVFFLSETTEKKLAKTLQTEGTSAWSISSNTQVISPKQEDKTERTTDQVENNIKQLSWSEWTRRSSEEQYEPRAP